MAHITNEKVWKVNGFVFKKTNFLWNGEDGARIEVSRNGKKLLTRQAHDVWILTKDAKNDFVEAEDQKQLKLSDLNGDGVLDFAIRQWSGGAYCCYIYEVFSLDGTCKRLWHNNAGCGHLKIISDERSRSTSPTNTSPHQTLKQRRRGTVLAMEDATFLQWRTHTVSGPRPVVYLAGTKNGFSIDRARMLKTVDRARFQKVINQPWSNESEELFIELVYSGHADEALRLLEKLPKEERLEFQTSFVQQFKKSPFYFQIVRLNSRDAIVRLQQKH